MKNDHICEERLLEIMDGIVPPTTHETDHLDHCPLCYGIYLEYQQIYPQLEQLPLEELPGDFSLRVLEQLPSLAPTPVEAGQKLLWLGLGLMIIGLLVGLQSFYGLFNSLSGKVGLLAESISRLFGSGSSLFTLFSSETIRLLLFIPLCFGAVGLLDRLIRRRFHPLTRG